MTAVMIVSAVLIGLGLLFMFASLIGIARFPDFFARLHAQGVGDTLGAFLVLAGMAAACGAGLLSVKILLIFVIIVLTNPIGTNLMMIAAINKEDYQGYSSFMSGMKKDAEPEEEAAEEPAPEQVEKAAEPEEEAAEEPAPEQVEKAAEPEEEAAKEPAPEEDIKASEPEENPVREKSSRNKGKGRQRRKKPSMNMNRAELLAIAAERGIEVPEDAVKRDILKLIYSGDDRNCR